MRALLVEDDLELLDLLSYALRREGYATLAATDGEQALTVWQKERPDIMVIDVNLPKIDGFEVCRRVRQESQTGIVMLTARDAEEDIVRGLRLGADDYVTKPFSARQLAARMAAVLRRRQQSAFVEPTRELRVGDIVIDLQSHEATRAGNAVQLTTLEFRIFSLLAMNAGRVIPYTRLVEYAWGYEGGDSGLLKTHVCHVRSKLGLSSGRNGGIRTVPGVGYSLAMA